MKNVLAHLAMHHAWGEHASFEWLHYFDHFGEIYESFADHLKNERANDEGYIGKCLSDLEWPVWWASLQTW